MGSLLISARMGRGCEFEREGIKVGSNDRSDTFVSNVNLHIRDLSYFSVVLNRSRRAGNTVFWHTNITPNDKRSFLIGSRLIRKLIDRMLSDDDSGRIRLRMMTKLNFEDRGAFPTFVEVLEEKLRSPVPQSLTGILTTSQIACYVVNTCGQLLLAILLSAKTLSYENKSCGLPIRIMFLWLENFAFCDNDPE